MKILTTVLILFLAMNAFGQTDINQKTDKGQKTGKWMSFYENGKTDEVWYYEPAIRKLNKKEAFVLGVSTEKDTTIYYEKLIWNEKYEYSKHWDLEKIVRKEHSKSPVYLYGSKKEIGVRYSEFDFKGYVDSTRTISLELTNYADKPIRLTLKANSNVITTNRDELILPANQITSFSFELTFRPNVNEYLLTLMNDNILMDFPIRAFGYHITSKDLENDNKLTSKKSFVYYRTGSEALLKLYDIDKKKVIETISLAKHRTNVELKKLKSGNYWLCVLDYSLDKQTFCQLKIEK